MLQEILITAFGLLLAIAYLLIVSGLGLSFLLNLIAGNYGRATILFILFILSASVIIVLVEKIL